MPSFSRLRTTLRVIALLCVCMVCEGGYAQEIRFPVELNLPDVDGKTFDTQRLKGRVSLVTFGYTHCPDFCPVTLLDLSTVMTELGPAADEINVVFVSIDPERDTPELLKDYVQSFDARIIALTGSREATEAAIQSFKVFVEKVPIEKGYVYAHGTSVYLIDKQAQFSEFLDGSRGLAGAAAQIRKLF